MGLRVQTNVSSINAQRHLMATTMALNEHTQRLSSGYRINKAADDAAGLAISSAFEADIRAMTQAKRNTADSISLVQTAEGGLQEISNILTRLKELSVQAANDTLGDEERSFVQMEFDQLRDEVDRIAYSTEFNGTRLLTGESPLPAALNTGNPPPLEIQVGANYSSEVDGLWVRNPVNIIRIELEKINALTSGEGSLGLGKYHATQKEVDDDEEELLPEVRVDSKQAAQLSMSRLDDALQKVSSYRATLGAIQNRLTHAMTNTGIMIENKQAAKSRIKDADYAEESSQVTQQTILQQAGVSVLSQANLIPQMALKLLGG